jgi:uncharacterized membrane protein
VSLAAVFFIIGRFIPINNLNLLVIGLASVFTAALFVKQQKKEPSNGEKLIFALVIAAVIFAIAIAVSFAKSGEADIASYIFSVKFLPYAPFNTFLGFVVIYTAFHFYTKNAMKRQTVNDEIH